MLRWRRAYQTDGTPDEGTGEHMSFTPGVEMIVGLGRQRSWSRAVARRVPGSGATAGRSFTN
jgi:hypothetical protein